MSDQQKKKQWLKPRFMVLKRDVHNQESIIMACSGGGKGSVVVQTANGGCQVKAGTLCGAACEPTHAS